MFLKQNKKSIIKWIIYYFILILFFSIQQSYGLLEINGTKPILIFSLAVVVAMFEEPLSSGVYGMFAGLLLDTSADKLLGFNGIIIFLICIGVSLFSLYYIRTKFINYLWILSVSILIQNVLDYVFYYLIWNYDNNFTIYLYSYLPVMLYTVCSSIIIYLIIKKIASSFNEIVRN